MSSKIEKEFGVFKWYGDKCGFIDVDDNKEISIQLNEQNIEYISGDFVYLLRDIYKKNIVGTEYYKSNRIRGRITNILDDVSIINEEICYFATKDKNGNKLKLGTSGSCEIVHGEYEFNEKSYDWRCISLITDELNTNLDDLKRIDTASWIENVNVINNDTRIYLKNKFDIGNKLNFEIPEDLYNLIVNGKKETIVEQLKEILIKSEDINFENYRKYFHQLVHIEEIEMVKSFASYNRSNVYLRYKSGKKFMFNCEDLYELRPSLACGDRVIASIEPADNASPKYDGIIKEILKHGIVIHFNEEFNQVFESNIAFNMKFVSSRSTFKKMHQAIEYVHENYGKHFLFPHNAPEKKNSQLDIVLNGNDMLLNNQKIEWLNSQLNHYQKNAVVQVLRSECHPLPYIIFGPPGTGKTTTLIEAIVQTFLNIPGCRIIVGTHTNSAADFITSKLIKYDFMECNLVRLIGYNFSLSDKLSSDLKKYYVTINHQERPENVIDDGIRRNFSWKTLDDYRIIISTNICVGQTQGKLMKKFSHIFIDEAAQAVEPEILIPFMLADKKDTKIVLAGDSKQMCPMVMSNYAIDAGLSISFFERIFELYKFSYNNTESTNLDCDKSLCSYLLLNYRSLPSILNLFNDLFYGSLLEPTISSVNSDEAKCLKKIYDCKLFNNFEDKPYLEFGVHFMDVKGRNIQEEDSPSWMNIEEAIQIMHCVLKLLKYGFEFDDIGVITPYRKQANFIQTLFKKQGYTSKVGSVEEFQGLERKIILVSTVRTNCKLAELDLKRGMGIIKCPKRLNVVLSRARALVIIFGRQELLKIDVNWKKMLEYCKQNDTYCNIN